MKQKISLFVFSLVFCLILTEIALSILIKKDLDNNLNFNNLHIIPFQLPVLETKLKLDKLINSNYNNNYQNVRLIPDTILGWRPNSNYEREGAIYNYDSNGIRTNLGSPKNNDEAEFTIAIFGDSYAHGDEVKFEETIGYFLEKLFEQDGVSTNVLNFAVSGYGMDQAYLRWLKVREEINPDIIILGVQFENVKRHINILRPLYSHVTDIPYSKPRFILVEDNIDLFENPIKDVREIIDVIKDVKNWEFSKYEGFYRIENYANDFWYNVKIYSTIKSLINRIDTEFEYYNPKSESYQITKKLFSAFKNCSIETEHVLIPVHLPTMDDFDSYYSSYLKFFHSKHFIYDDLFFDLKREIQFVETFDKLEEWSSDHNVEKLFVKRHYSSIANKIIAEQIYMYIYKKHSNLFKN